MAMDEYSPTMSVESMTDDGIAPPTLVGIAVGDIATSLVNSNQSGLYEISGASSLTVNVMVKESESAELLAQMV